MPIAYSYARCSTGKQKQGFGLARQLEDAISYCRKMKWTLDETLKLRDLIGAFRGKNSAKGALGQFLAAIKTGRIKKGEILICESIDRLSRMPYDPTYMLIREILSAGVDIVTLTPERHLTYDSLNDTRIIMELAWISATAHEESQKKSHRSLDNWDRKRKGQAASKSVCPYTVTSVCPHWLRLADDKKSFVPIPERVAIVKRIFEMSINGKGHITISKELNADKVPPPPRNKEWNRISVQSILQNSAVIGEYTPKTLGKALETRKNYYPAIITEDVWYRAIQARQQRQGKIVGKVGHGVANLFTSLLRDKDGRGYNVQAKRSDRKCLVPHSAQQGSGRWVTFRYDIFEYAFLRFLTEIKESDIFFGLDSTADKVNALIAKLDTLTAKIHAAKKQLDKGDVATIFEWVAEWEADKKETKKELERVKLENLHPQKNLLKDTQALVDFAKDKDKRFRLRQLIRELISGIEIAIRNDYTISPDRVFVQEVECVDSRARGKTKKMYQVKLASGEVLPLRQYCKERGIKDCTIYGRLNYYTEIPPDKLLGGPITCCDCRIEFVSGTEKWLTIVYKPNGDSAVYQFKPDDKPEWNGLKFGP